MSISELCVISFVCMENTEQSCGLKSEATLISGYQLGRLVWSNPIYMFLAFWCLSGFLNHWIFEESGPRVLEKGKQQSLLYLIINICFN